MEDKRTAIALFICIGIVMVYTQVMFPQQTRVITVPQTQIQPQTQAAGSPNIPPVNQTAGQTAEPIANPPQIQSTHPTQEQLNASGSVSVSSNKFEVSISKLGGRIEKLILKEYRKQLDSPEPMNLILESPDASFPLGLVFENSTDELVLYSAAKDSYSVEGGDVAIELTGSHPTLGTIKKTITFSPGSYLFHVAVSAEKLPSTPEAVWLEWTHSLTQTDEKKRLDPIHFTSLLVDNTLKNTQPAKLQQQSVVDQGLVRWTAISEKYFMATVIPQNQNARSQVGITSSSIFMRVSAPQQASGFVVYAGPKDLDILEQFDSYKLVRGIDLGFFSFLAQPLLRLLHFFESFLHNYGLAIILLTLVIKMCFLPLTRASIRSMQAMQELQPEMKALRERIKDATQLNQEVMALYKKKGVNPVGGCLPILVQIPVFFGLYSALLHSFELRHAPFALWIKDLSAPENLHLFGIRFPLMILLMGGSMIFQQWTTPTAGMDPAQAKMMKFMPVIFTAMFIVFPMPSGLVLYWLINNIISITQQLYLRGHRKADPFTATLAVSLILFGIGYVLTLL
jgi:YidC/Oxa1 family membrane protein insertase